MVSALETLQCIDFSTFSINQQLAEARSLNAGFLLSNARYGIRPEALAARLKGKLTIIG